MPHAVYKSLSKHYITPILKSLTFVISKSYEFRFMDYLTGVCLRVH